MAHKSTYSTAQITIHWVTAGLVLFQFFVNDGASDVFKARLDGEVETDGIGGALVHVTVGLTILALAITRTILRFTRGVPPHHADTPAILTLIAKATHFLLYLFIFGMPITGAIAWFGGIELSGDMHELGRYILLPLIVLHAAGAVFEHFVFRNDSLMRMLPFLRPAPKPAPPGNQTRP